MYNKYYKYMSIIVYMYIYFKYNTQKQIDSMHIILCARLLIDHMPIYLHGKL